MSTEQYEADHLEFHRCVLSQITDNFRSCEWKRDTGGNRSITLYCLCITNNGSQLNKRICYSLQLSRSMRFCCAISLAAAMCHRRERNSRRIHGCERPGIALYLDEILSSGMLYRNRKTHRHYGILKKNR